MQRKLLIIVLIITASRYAIAGNGIINTVDHKNVHLVQYLDLIKYNIDEKIEILPYILKQDGGIFLEIGTGGDPIEKLLTQIPSNFSTTIIASDVDNNILELLPQRHIKLTEYINASSGPKLVLKQLNAIDMNCFANNSLSGINASSVVHEIVSYAGGINALESFFSEAFRVLKSDGILIYRDPESVLYKNKIIKANFKNKSIKLFTHIFLTKFLDTSYSKLAKSNKKFIQYNTDDITFYCYKQYCSNLCKLNYNEYLKTQSYDIDFSRQYTMDLPIGLCREIERHYIVYLKECNPLAFIKCMPTVNSDKFFINYLSNNSKNALDLFLQQYQISISNHQIDSKVKDLLNVTIDNTLKPMEFGVRVIISSQIKKQLLINLLKHEGFEPSIYIKLIKKDTYLLDYRIFSLFYDYISESILDHNNRLLYPEDAMHAIYLKSEGDESYCYYSDDELITRVAKISLSKSEDSMILCPISAEHNKFVPRLCYQKILKDVLDINDNAGYSIKNREGKRVIHFQKMNLNSAIKIYKNIIKSDPERYTHLQNFIDGINNAK